MTSYVDKEHRPPAGWDAASTEPTQHDRAQALRWAIDLHKNGQEVSRGWAAVLATAGHFLDFMAGKVDATTHHAEVMEAAKRAMQVMYKHANRTTDPVSARELREAARQVNEALRLVPPPEEDILAS